MPDAGLLFALSPALAPGPALSLPPGLLLAAPPAARQAASPAPALDLSPALRSDVLFALSPDVPPRLSPEVTLALPPGLSFALPLALLLAAVAVLALPAHTRIRRTSRSSRSVDPLVRRAAFPAVGAGAALLLLGAPWWLTLLVAAAAAYAGVRAARRERPLTLAELRSLAALLDVFAACLDAGLAPASALNAVIGGPGSRRPPGRGQEALAQAAALLQLGGQPSEAWRPVARIPALAGLAAAAMRSAAGGLTLADAAREASTALRTRCRTVVTDRAARAGVTMTAPLTLCFLPAFLCLGLAPTVIGMVSTISLW